MTTPAMTIENLTLEIVKTMDIISKLTDSRNKAIHRLAEINAGYVNLLVAVADDTKPQSELDDIRDEVARLTAIIAEPTVQAVEVFHKRAQEIHKQMDLLHAQQRAVDSELSFRRQLNLVMTEKLNSASDWEILENSYQRHHWQDLCRLKELRSGFAIATADITAKGFVSFCHERGFEPYDLNVTPATINLPRG